MNASAIKQIGKNRSVARKPLELGERFHHGAIFAMRMPCQGTASVAVSSILLFNQNRNRLEGEYILTRALLPSYIAGKWLRWSASGESRNSGGEGRSGRILQNGVLFRTTAAMKSSTGTKDADDVESSDSSGVQERQIADDIIAS